MRAALIVGIDDYPEIPLSGCVNDALRIAELLRTHDDGSLNFEVRILTDASAITKPILRKNIEDLFSRQCEVAMFYFSGHGYINQTGGIVVTPDYRRYDEGIPMEQILTLANNSSVKERIIIVDCCYSGALGEIGSLGENLSVLKEGISILSASRSTEPALESASAGVFTSLLCDAMDGGASDILGKVKTGNLYAYIDEALGVWDQRPIFKTNVSQFAVLRKCSPYIPLDILRKLTDCFPDPDYVFPLDPSYEPDANPKHEEHEAVFGILQKYRAGRLLEPVGAEHMYFAAMNSQACRLTPLGKKYWNLAQRGAL